ncbi:pentapeptide repeat-containing protein [Nostoc sp.]|uniref:pentapeptide repeat-containing protein n=1 Tax=Nostoc sp. TaxID=1180 RepID=UPI002FF57587
MKQISFSLLKLGIPIWNQWKGNFGEKIDLRGKDLEGVYLSEGNFTKVDLSYANLTNAYLREADFSEATLNHANFSKAYMGGANLSHAHLIRASLEAADLRESNLLGADLSHADLKMANLSYANLDDADFSGANLSDANLSRTSLSNTCLSGAILTGSCLKDTLFRLNTNFDGVICEYFYSEEDKKERRPLNGHFLTGEFEALVQKACLTIDLVFVDGIDWKSFFISYQNLREKYGEKLSIQALEKKRNEAFVIRLEVSAELNAKEVEKNFKESYENQINLLKDRLERRDKEFSILLQANTNLTGVVKIMQEKQGIQPGTTNINIHNMTASTINLGKISGIVSNRVSQLPESPEPDQIGLKELLTQLQNAIEQEKELSPQDKADLLEQVAALADAMETPEQTKKEGLVRKAQKMFKATLIGLPDTAKIVDACSQLLPAILKVLGLPM